MLWSRCLYGLPFWVFFYQSDCTQVRHTHQHWVGGRKGVYVTTPTCECLFVKHRYPKLLVKAFAYVVCVLWTRHCLCLFSFCAVVMWSTCAEYTWHETAKVVRATDAMQSCWPWTKAAFDNYKAAAAAAMIDWTRAHHDRKSHHLTSAEWAMYMCVQAVRRLRMFTNYYLTTNNWAKTWFCRGSQRGSPLTSQLYVQNVTLVYIKL